MAEVFCHLDAAKGYIQARIPVSQGHCLRGGKPDGYTVGNRREPIRGWKSLRSLAIKKAKWAREPADSKRVGDGLNRPGRSDE